MTWVRLDDAFFRHPKVIRAGRDARDLYLAALCYCQSGLTDGFVDESALRRLAADAEVEDALRLAERLIAVGLWEPAEGGYQIHDYQLYNPASERVKRDRAENVRRQAEWRERNREARNAVTNAPNNGPVTPAPYPLPSVTPYPVPGTEGSPSGVLAQQQPARRRATAAASEEIPEKFSATDEILRECRGYQPSARLWGRIDRDYGGIDLEREALKLASWLAEHPKRTASARQILNWLDVAAKRQAEALATGPPRAAPSTNGAYHGDGSELARAMAQERAEQAKRMQEAMAKRE